MAEEWIKDPLSKWMTEYLSTKDLRSLQLTNKYWKDISNQEIKKRRKEYQEFVDAIENEDIEGVKIGLEKGMELSNQSFIEILKNKIMDKLYKAKNNIYFYFHSNPEFVSETISTLNPDNINKGEKSLLDQLIELLASLIQLVDNSDVPKDRLNKYIYLTFQDYASELLNLGAIIKHPKSIPIDLSIILARVLQRRDDDFF